MMAADLNGKSILLRSGCGGANRHGEMLGIGDLVRILTMAPSIGAREIDWCSPPSLFPLAEESRFISKCFEPAEFEIYRDRYDAIVNLSLDNVGADYELSEQIDDGAQLKDETFDLLNKCRQFLGIPSAAGLPVTVTVSAPPRPKTHDIGLNWKVPGSWQIKALPDAHWNDIEAALATRYTVSRQPDTDDLKSYMRWVSEAQLIISVVGLGCHLAMFYGEKLVLLSGPTDFAEAEDYPSGRVIRPSGDCAFRPCNLKSGKDDCGCMPMIDRGQVIRAAEELLTQ